MTGIDVMVAGGGHERIGDADDYAGGFNGHDANFQDTYPIVTAGADGKPALIVTTDTEYTYLGRLVVDFNAAGEIIVGNLDPSDQRRLRRHQCDAGGRLQSTAKPPIRSLTAAPSARRSSRSSTPSTRSSTPKDSNIFGYTDVYLEGDRVFGRAQETNLGDHLSRCQCRRRTASARRRSRSWFR